VQGELEKQLGVYLRAVDREKRARKEAERLLEDRALELYRTNIELQELNRSLEQKVSQRAKEINEQRNFYESILNQVPAEIIVADRNQNYIFISQSAVNDPTLREWLIGKNDFAFCSRQGLPLEFAQERASHYQEVRNTLQIAEWTEHLDRDGEDMYFMRRLLPLFNDNEEIEMFIGYSLDITSSEKYRHELTEARDIAQKATSAKSEFLSKISHEIRTPLNAIIGLTNILMNDDHDNTQGHYLQSMKYSADSLLGIINEVLDFSKIEAGKITFESIPFNFSHLIQGVHQTFEFRATEIGIDLKIKLDPDIPRIIEGDRVKLNQIFLNLVGNAMKFTSKGQIIVEAKLLVKTDDRLSIRFSVKDSGIGIAPDKLDKVFESFSQEGEDTTRKFGGTGLGLTITKKFIEGQKGKLWVESIQGEGSQFFFELDFKYNSDHRENSSIKKEWSRDLSMVKGKRILVAEDNLMNQLVFQKMLEKWGPLLDMVSNGALALEKLHQEDYDLVFLDVQMPIKDGITTVKEWRDYEVNNLNNRQAIVALTADAFSESRQRVIDAGMDDFLSKPIEISELRRVLSKYLNPFFNFPYKCSDISINDSILQLVVMPFKIWPNNYPKSLI
jgi:signal transduction histidine kinase/CheY-like chemotaxis protein